MSQIADELVARMDIVALVSQYVQLKRVGSNFSGLCPFHNEKTPSFVVSPQKQIFKCFGCGAGGNALKFFMDIERMDFWDAVTHLAQKHNVDIQKYDIHTEKITENQTEREKLKRLHACVQEFFHHGLVENAEARRYIQEKRNIPQNIVNHFGLGYASANQASLLQFCKKKGFTAEDLQQASLAKKHSNGDRYPFFSHRITIPIWDQQGRVVAFGARVINPEDKPKYLNSGETAIYQKSQILYGINFLKDSIKAFGKVIIVEGYMDVISLAVGGFPIGLATCGTALTKYHVDIIKRYTEDVYFLFDNDTAGQQATIRGLKIAYASGLYPRIISLPVGYKDIDNLVMRENGQGEEETKLLINKIIVEATDGFWWVFLLLGTQHDLKEPVQKKKILTEMFGLIQTMTSINIQDDYLNLLAEKVKTSQAVLLGQYKQYCTQLPKWQRSDAHEDQTKKWLLDKRKLVASFCDPSFLSQFSWATQPRIDAFVQLRGKLAPVLTDTSGLEEFQLWREDQLEKKKTDEEKLSLVMSTVLGLCNDLLKETWKIGTFTAEQKQEMLHLLDEMKKGS